MSNPGGCPPHIMLEVSRTEAPRFWIVNLQCGKCPHTEQRTEPK